MSEEKTPSLAQKGWAFTMSMMKFAGSGFAQTTKEQYEERLSICEPCEFRGKKDEITIEMLQARLKELQEGIKENDEKLSVLAELREKNRKSLAELDELIKKLRVEEE